MLVTPDSRRRLGDISDVASICKCSTRTVRRRAELNLIPGMIRIGKLIRFDLDLISRWIDAGAPPTPHFNSQPERNNQ